MLLLSHRSHVWPCGLQGPLSLGFPRQVLEWVAMPSSKGSSWPREQTWVSCIAGRFFTTEPSRKPFLIGCHNIFKDFMIIWHWGQNLGLEGKQAWVPVLSMPQTLSVLNLSEGYKRYFTEHWVGKIRKHSLLCTHRVFTSRRRHF